MDCTEYALRTLERLDTWADIGEELEALEIAIPAQRLYPRERAALKRLAGRLARTVAP